MDPFFLLVLALAGITVWCIFGWLIAMYLEKRGKGIDLEKRGKKDD